MDWITEIKNMVDNQFHYHADKGNKITFIEEKVKNRQVVLEKSYAKTFTIQLDKEKIIKEIKGQDDVTSDIHIMLNEKEGLKKKCDFVVFCHSIKDQKKLYVLFIELKSKYDSGWKKQTVAGEAIIMYLLRIFESYSGQKILKQNTEFRHIVFSTKRSFKNKSKSGKVDYKTDTFHDIKFVERTYNEYDLENFLI